MNSLVVVVFPSRTTNSKCNSLWVVIPQLSSSWWPYPYKIASGGALFLWFASSDKKWQESFPACHVSFFDSTSWIMCVPPQHRRRIVYLKKGERIKDCGGTSLVGTYAFYKENMCQDRRGKSSLCLRCILSSSGGCSDTAQKPNQSLRIFSTGYSSSCSHSFIYRLRGTWWTI